MTDKMIISVRTNYIKTLLSFLTCVAVIVSHLHTATAAPFHSSNKKIDKETEQIISKIEPQEQESISTYDQRQSGQYNIKVNIKDVKIIFADKDGIEGSLDDDTIYDYGDYDYDPSHLTVSPLPIFGIGSVSLTSSKPPKSSTKVPSSTTIKYGTKYTTDKPQRTTVTIPSTTPIQLTSTTEIFTPTPVAIMPLVQNQPLEAETSNGLLSADTFAENHATTENIQTTVKHTHTGKPVKVQQVPLSGHYDYQNIPVQVITDPFYKRSSKI
ncbi:uncharacterized protein LOC125762800 [Anopheles funestus]|uniref:uncharacterized protein LOC125762800 n=1 Tax=Anopheles funestus TaxID=62324 RepID=UPI0020C6F3EA|nr:uncharacterized protein LOC125762800 [Anopheles funestus]